MWSKSDRNQKQLKIAEQSRDDRNTNEKWDSKSYILCIIFKLQGFYVGMLAFNVAHKKVERFFASRFFACQCFFACNVAGRMGPWTTL